MSLGFVIGAAIAAAAPAAGTDAIPPRVVPAATDRQGVLEIADALASRGRRAEALALIEALTPEDRASADARFAKAVLLIDLGRAVEAERLLAVLVDEQPAATRIRLEHGRALALRGRLGAAERQLRRALADDPPPGVVTTVGQALRSLQSRRRLIGGFGFGLAPDTNINAATSADTVELFGIPFDLDPSARARSGIGITGNAELGWRQPVSPDVAMIVRANGSARIYPRKNTQADDVTVELRTGVETGRGSSRITPELTWLRRWYAGDGYATALGAGLRLDQQLAGAWFASAIADVRRVTHDRNLTLDGWAGSLRVEASHPLSADALLVVGGTASRVTARDPGYAHWLGELDLALHKDFRGGWSTGLRVTGGRLVGDEAMLSFGKVRQDWRTRGSVSIANRRLHLAGLMPRLRLQHDRTFSSIPLYDYRRTRLDMTFDYRF